MNNFFFWLKQRLFRKGAMSQYREEMKNQNLELQDLKALNWERRKKIVEYAYSYVKFYKEYYDACGFHPSQLKEEKDWALVPILEKNMVRKNVNDMIDSHIELNKKDFFMIESTTGGSTGMPLQVYIDKKFHFEALGWRAFSWWHISPGDNVGILHRRVPTSFWGKFKNRLLWWPTKRIYLSAISMTEQQLSDFVNNIIKRRIVWLQGYAGTLESVADYILKSGMKISTLKMVWSTSTPLMPHVRQKMEKAFNCKIMNQYGSCEVPNIAQQCPNSEHLHIHYDAVHVDVVDEEGNLLMEQQGDVLVTSLLSYAFPLIKYRLGDKGTLLSEKCKCGITLPLLKEIRGRITDQLYTPCDIMVSGHCVSAIFADLFEFVDKYQIRQRIDYSIDVYFVFKSNTPADIQEGILSSIREKIIAATKGEVDVRMLVVPRIPDNKGKIQYVISEVALQRAQNKTNINE